MEEHLFEDREFRVVDTHAHLDEFQDLKGVVERAKKAGVVGVVAVSVHRSSSVKSLEFSRVYDGYVFPAIGIHPWEVEEAKEDDIAFIEKNADRCVAVGEIGLDYWIKTDKEKQRRVFEKLVEIAVKKNKPSSIHSRGAWEEAYKYVEEIEAKKALFHWYSGPLEILKKILDRGYYVSASPASEYSKKHREALQQTPLENLVLETDCPVKYKGAVSEPADVLKTLRYVSELKKVNERALAEKTTDNAVKLFGFNI